MAQSVFINIDSKKMIGLRSRHGYTLIEVSIAILLMGAIAIGVARVLTDSTRHSRIERHKATATRLAQGIIERLRAAGPVAHDIVADTFRVRGNGARDDAGPYQIEIATDVNCDAGDDPEKNVGETQGLSSNCADMRARLTYRVLVRFPHPRTEQPFGDSVTLQLSLGPSARYARTYASP